MKTLLLGLSLIFCVTSFADSTTPPENQVLVQGECRDYLVHGHFLFSIQVTGEDSTLDGLNKSLGKNFDKLVYRLGRTRLKGLEYKIVQSDVQKSGSGYKGVKTVDVYVAQNQKLKDIEKLVAKTSGASITKAQSVLVDSAKKSAVSKCIAKATEEAKSKANSVAKSLKIKLNKKPLNIEVNEEFVDSTSTTGSGGGVSRKELLVTVKIGFKIK